MPQRWDKSRGALRAILPVLIGCAVVAAALASAPRVQAATRTWDGGGGDGLWSTAANWSLNTLPIPGDTVIFDGTSTAAAAIDVPVTVASLQMNAGYTGTVTQAAGQAVVLTSYTQSAGTFTAGASTVTVTGLSTVNAGGTFNGGGATLNLNGGLTVAGAFNAGASTMNVTGTTTVSAAGTFAGNTATINLTGALTVNATGAFTSTSGTLTVTGAVTLAAGVFTHNSGTVVLSTSSVNVALTGGATFNNVQFLSGTKTISSGTMTVVGTLTLTGGAMNTGTVAAQGAISVAPTFTGGTGTLLINGTSPQTWTGGGATSDLPLVNINNPTSTLTMTGTFRTTRNWTFTASGGLTASASTVIFASTQAITGTHTLGAVEIAGVTVTIATGTTLSAAGTLTLTSGILNQAGATGTLAAQGDITIATAFTGGTATLLINGTTPQTWSGSSNGAADTLNVVNINDPVGTLTITASLRTTHNWTFTASGGLTASASSIIFAGGTITGSHTLGTVEIAGAEIISAGTTVSAGGNLTLTTGTLNQAGATGTLAAQGNISIAAAFTGGSATLLINGTTPQTWSGSSNGAADTLNVVNINDPVSTLTITASLRTNHNWTFTASGGLTASASSIIFAGGTITGSHTMGTVEIAGGVTIAAGTTLTVPGTLTLTSGTLTTGTLAAQGNITIATAFTGGTTTLLINGTTPQTWSGSSNGAADTLTLVDINNPTSTLTITASLRTTHNWTFTASGGLTASASSIIFAGGIITGTHALGVVEVAGGVTIAAGTTLTVPGILTLTSGTLTSGTLAAQADISAAVAFTGGTTTLLINGSGAQGLQGFQTSLAGGMPNVDINKASGVLTISGILRTGRNWTVTNASAGLAVSGSTLVFTGSSATTITGSHTLNNVEIRGGTINIAAGTTLTVTGSTDLVSGTLNQAAATGTLAAQADISIAVAFTGGSATLLINGSIPQTWSGTSNGATDTLLVVDINNPTSTLTITASLRTTHNWTFTASGGLTASASSVIFAGGTITGTHTLGAVEIAGAVIIAAGTTLNVPGTLTLTSGTLNQAAATGTLAAQGDVNAQLGSGGGSATLLFNGAGNQTLTGFHTTAAGALPIVNINKPSGTLTIAGTLRTGANWTYTAGGLTATGSTLVFVGGTITGSHTLAAVEIRGGTITIAVGTTLTVTGPLNLFSGALNTGTLAAQGDVNAQLGSGGGSATLLFNGAGNQTLTGFHTTAAGALPIVNINKPSGTLTIAGTLRTGANWTYTAGGLTATGSTLVFVGGTITGSHTLAAVEIRGGTITIAVGTTLTVTGPLNLFSGALNTGTLAAQGDVNAQLGSGGGSATLLFNGAGNQTLTGFHTTAAGALPIVNINKPSGTLTIAGTLRTGANWTYTAGGLTATGSTLVFVGGTITGSHTLAAVEIRGGTITIAVGTTLTVTGPLNLFSGALNTGTLAAQGDVNAQLGSGGGSATLLFNGAGNQTLTGFHTTAAGALPIVNINKPSGTLTIAGTLRTPRDWTYVAGGLTATGSTLVFAGTLSINAGAMAFNDVVVNAGTVTLANNLTTNGDLTVAAGTLAIGSHTVFAAGNVTENGNITATTGTLDMNGLAGQTLGGSTTIGLFNLTINDPLGVTQATTVTVAGTLTLNGPLDFAGESLTISNPIAGSPTNLTCDAASTLVITGSGSGIVVPTSISTLGALTLSNANGVALAGPLTVATTLTLTSGAVNTGGNVLSIGPAGSVVRTSGRVNGPLQKWVPIGSGVSVTFQIGDATTYAPITLTFGTVSVTGQLTASTTPGEHPSIGTSIIDPAQDVNRWWSLTNAGIGFTTLSATFTFTAGDRDPGAQTSQFVVVKWDGAWSSPASGGNTATTITASGISSLSDFAVGEVGADLTIVKVGPTYATAGDPAGFDYTLTVHNAGPADNVTGFTVTDTLAGALTFQPLGSDGRCSSVGQVVTCANVVGLADGADDLFVIHVTLGLGNPRGNGAHQHRVGDHHGNERSGYLERHQHRGDVGGRGSASANSYSDGHRFPGGHAGSWTRHREHARRFTDRRLGCPAARPGGGGCPTPGRAELAGLEVRRLPVQREPGAYTHRP